MRAPLLAIASLALPLAACRPAPLVPPPIADDTLLHDGETLRWTFDEPQWHAGSGFAMPRPHAQLFALLGRWSVEPDGSAPSPPRVLCQSGRYADRDEPRLYATKVVFEGVTEEVECRVDARSACGLAFGARGADHYVVARADARAGAITLVLVDGDDVRPLASAAAKVTPGVWHRLAVHVEAETSRADVEWDGAPAVAGTLPHGAGRSFGRVGLAAGGEGAACFDDWSVRAARSHLPPRKAEAASHAAVPPPSPCEAPVDLGSALFHRACAISDVEAQALRTALEATTVTLAARATWQADGLVRYELTNTGATTLVLPYRIHSAVDPFPAYVVDGRGTKTELEPAELRMAPPAAADAATGDHFARIVVPPNTTAFVRLAIARATRETVPGDCPPEAKCSPKHLSRGPVAAGTYTLHIGTPMLGIERAAGADVAWRVE